MELNEAKDIFREITEICSEINHPILNEAIPSLQYDVDKATSSDEIIPNAAEIIILLEQAIEDYKESQEYMDKVQELSELLYE